MTKPYVMDRTYSAEDEHGNVLCELECRLHFTVSAGRCAGTQQGEYCYPAEPPEVEIIKIEVEDWRRGEAKPFWREATEREYDGLDTWAENLADEMVAHIIASDLADREYADEMRAEAARERRMLGD